MTRLLALACLLLISVNADAADLIVSGGQLMGATGVEVNGNLYDVGFLDGTCIDIYGGCDSVSDFTFHTAPQAEAASQALLDQVFIDGTSGNFDSVSLSTLGSGNRSICRAITSYGIYSDDSLVYLFSYAVNGSGTNNGEVTIGGVSGASYDSTPPEILPVGSYDLVYAQWQISEVPSPAGTRALGPWKKNSLPQ